MRKKMNRQSITLAAGAGAQDRVVDAERRVEGLREELEGERRGNKEEERRRKRAEARICECPPRPG